MNASLVVLLHVCDSLFPIGGFAHSDGLEAAAASGGVGSAVDLERWMRTTLQETLRRFEGPAVKQAWRACSIRGLAQLRELDDDVRALRPSSTGRDASLAMGNRLLKTWQELRPHPVVEALLSVGAGSTLPVAFGVVTAASGVPERDAIQGYSYTRLAAVVSTAMRLLPIGQREAHGLLTAALDLVPHMTEEILDSEEPPASFAPALDIAAMSQQYVHSRLFRS